MAQPTSSDWKLCARLLAEGRPYKVHLAGILGLHLLATPLELLLPLPLAMVINGLVGANPLPPFLNSVFPEHSLASASTIPFAIGLLMLIALFLQLQKLASAALVAYTGERLLLDFRSRLFRHVQAMSVSYHELRGTADANYRIHWDAAASQWIWIHGLIPLLSSAFLFVGMLYVTLLIDWQLALVALAVAPVLALITVGARRALRNGWETTKKLESSAQNVVHEVLSGLRLVKAFGQENREQDRFVSQSGAGARQRIRLAYLDASFGMLFGLTLAAGTALVLFLGGRKVEAGAMTPGDLVLVMAYLAQLYGPVQLMTKSINMLQSALASAGRAFALLDEAPDVVEKPHARPLARAVGDISFRQVCFSYDRRVDVLRNVSFDIPRHCRVGIAGATGAGKTTLIGLLARFHDPSSGQILLDGIDLRDYRVADLRQQFSIVLQEPVLFSAAVAENIAYAKPTASQAEIVAAAKAAHAHDFISALPNGYETVLGERGMRLSGGERQRISLARAFLKDAPILILDEPTSSVDVRTEASIMEAMQHLMHRRTSVMIAHRASTLRECDVIFTVDAGQVLQTSRDGFSGEQLMMTPRLHTLFSAKSEAG